MNIVAARKLAKYRLFRPLTLDSEHYQHYRSDRNLAKKIATWASNVLLGGHYYDLKVKPEYIFQVHSNRMNRMVYIIPVWNPDLVRKIVLESTNKTDRAKKGCGICNLKDIEFVGGILKLSRVFFRGTAKYLQTHKSKSDWFVEDRYNMDIFAYCPKKVALKTGLIKDNKKSKTQFRAIFRVFHNSIGCVAIPAWAPSDNISEYNDSIKTNVAEYHPEPEDVIMNWHELAYYLGVQNTGIYALANILSEQQSGNFDTDERKCFQVRMEADYSDQNQPRRIYLPQDFDPSQPLSLDLTRNYTHFWARKFFALSNGLIPLIYPIPTPYVPNTYSNTFPPIGVVGIGLINFLSEKIGNAGKHIGNGFFLLKSSNSLQLAVGTGNWGSSENHGIRIDTTIDVGSNGDAYEGVTGSGGHGLLIDGARWFFKDKIKAEAIACRSNATSAECQECLSGSTGQIFHDLGTVADLLDVIGGIAACIVASVFGQGWVCGVTLPSAGAAAKDFWDNTIGGYDYAEDVCSGLPDQSPVYDDEPAVSECINRKITNIVWTSFTSETDCENMAWQRCMEHIGPQDANGWILKEARCEEIKVESNGEHEPNNKSYVIYCKYCKPPHIS